MFSANSSQVSDDKLFVEDVFSTYLYTGNGSTQTITNGIDLAGKGGLVWTKRRVSTGGIGDTYHILTDTVRGANKQLYSNGTNAQATNADMITSFNANGYSIGSDGNVNFSNASPQTYASWTFREAPKFFDIVTYTGNGTAGRTVAHSLGVAPGTIIVKRTDADAGWRVYHRSQPNGYGDISSTDAFYTNSAERVFGNGSTVVAPTSTDFTIGDATSINGSGATFVAYLYAHDATSDGVIQCGSFTSATTATVSVTTGWEPQWIMVKRSDATGGSWYIVNNMTGLNTSAFNNRLVANSSAAEGQDTLAVPNATGFSCYTVDGAGTYIYIAIRRGPMRTPTLGTSVFAPIARNGTNANATITTGFTVDLHISKTRTVANSPGAFDRLRGAGNFLNPASTAAQDAVNYLDSLTSFANNTGVGVGADSGGGIINFGTRPYANWAFRRAPGFMDVVCYTGTGVARTVNHNLGVVPELMIVKRRDSAGNWLVYSAATGATKSLFLNFTDPSATFPYWNNTSPTASVFSIGTTVDGNGSGGTYVAYLFASCPGVSKVGSYTGNGSSQTINCGFAAGARFVMIKRTDSTGDWYVWDTARGIVAGNDPYLALNDISAEVTTNDSVDTDSSGFVVNQDAATNVNVNAATYIYLAIA